MRLYHYKKECCGCEACVSVCKQKAISFKKDEYGFFYPNIDYEKCVNCGLCKKVCSFNKGPFVNTSLIYMLAKHKDNQVLSGSTSGGIYTAISDSFLEKGESVYSPTFNEELDIVTKKILNQEERDASRGSKYVQSRMGNIYEEVLDDLKSGKKVAFFGTPCQVAAINNTINKKYLNNLYTIDIICNGVGSPGVWQSFIGNKQKKYYKRIINYVFRPKTNGYLTTSEVCVFDDGTFLETNNFMEKFNYLYYKGLVLRPACSNCQYANQIRVSDITIGDFSAAKDKFPEFDSRLGASTIIINTEKGKKIFQSIVDKIDFIEVDVHSCEQKRLRECVSFNKKSLNFCKIACGKGISCAIKKDLGVARRIKYFLKDIIKHRK